MGEALISMLELGPLGFFLGTVVELELKGQGWRGYSTASTAKVK